MADRLGARSTCRPVRRLRRCPESIWCTNDRLELQLQERSVFATIAGRRLPDYRGWPRRRHSQKPTPRPRPATFLSMLRRKTTEMKKSRSSRRSDIGEGGVLSRRRSSFVKEDVGIGGAGDERD